MTLKCISTFPEAERLEDSSLGFSIEELAGFRNARIHADVVQSTSMPQDTTYATLRQTFRGETPYEARLELAASIFEVAVKVKLGLSLCSL